TRFSRDWSSDVCSSDLESHGVFLFCWFAAGHPANRKPAKEEDTMRFMIIVKADQDSEAGVMPSEELLAAMMKYNEELAKAGVMLAGEGLHPSSRGARVRFEGSKRTVIDGPFTESKELVAGFWIWQAGSMQEAIEWLKKAPFDGGTEVEIRQIFETEDFDEVMRPELRQQGGRPRRELEPRPAGREERRRKKEEGRREMGEGRREKGEDARPFPLLPSPFYPEGRLT